MAKKKPSKKRKIPQTSDVKAARQALIQADLLGFEANRAELSSVSKGAFRGVRLRSGGTSLSRYRIGKPKADKGSGYKNIGKPPKYPSGGGTRRTTPRTTTPKTTTKTRTPLAKTAAAVRKRHPELSTKEIRARARAIIAKRKAPKRVTPRKSKPRTTPENPLGKRKF